jgi:O-antigen/teichoic acid export membrane protein
MGQMTRLLRATGLLTLSAVLTGVGNFGFNVLVARQGGPEAYGAVAPLLAVAAIATVLTTATTFAVARMVVTSHLAPRPALRRSVRALAPWLALSVALMALAGPIDAYLHLGGPQLVVYAVLFGAAGVASGSPLGVLLGMRRFGLMALLTIFMPVARVAALEVLRLVLSVETAALLASLLAGVLAVALAVLVVMRLPGHAGEPVSGSPGSVAQESLMGSLLAGALWVTWAIPVAFARHVLPPAIAGDLAAVQLLATGVIYLAAPVVTVFYPQIARDATGRSARHGFVATLAVSSVAAAGLIAVGPAVTPRLYGSAFGTPLLLFVALGGSAVAIATCTYVLWASRAAERFTVVTGAAVVLAFVAELAMAPAMSGRAVTLALLPLAGLIAAVTVVAAGVMVHHQARHLDAAARSSACLACLALRS